MITHQKPFPWNKISVSQVTAFLCEDCRIPQGFSNVLLGFLHGSFSYRSIIGFWCPSSKNNIPQINIPLMNQNLCLFFKKKIRKHLHTHMKVYIEYFAVSLLKMSHVDLCVLISPYRGPWLSPHGLHSLVSLPHTPGSTGETYGLLLPLGCGWVAGCPWLPCTNWMPSSLEDAHLCWFWRNKTDAGAVLQEVSQGKGVEGSLQLRATRNWDSLPFCCMGVNDAHKCGLG
jgi:hypothetical protein